MNTTVNTNQPGVEQIANACRCSGQGGFDRGRSRSSRYIPQLAPELSTQFTQFIDVGQLQDNTIIHAQRTDYVCHVQHPRGRHMFNRLSPRQRKVDSTVTAASVS